jgi:hypothetical protein
MAQLDTDANDGISDKRYAAKTQSGSNLATAASYQSIASLDARLTAINAGYWTAARLNSYCKNDKVYAVRLADDAAGL